MQLQDIDKRTYRRHLNIAIAVAIGGLSLLSIGSAAVLIHFFSDGQGSDFIFNLLGFAFSVAVSLVFLRRAVKSPYLAEAVYMWRLKQVLNRIYNKLAKVKAAVEDDDRVAIQVLHYFYQGSIQIYTLDDNTLTIRELQRDFDALDERIARLGLSIEANAYDEALLQHF